MHIEKENLRNRVESVLSKKELNTLTGVLQKVQRLTSNLRSSSEELAKTISSDSVLTAKVLQTVNSAHYGLQRRISSIEEAIVMVGFSQLRTMCAGLLSATAMGGESRSKGFDRVALWKHALGTGTAAGYLQKNMVMREGTDCFTAGLLCNFGRIILDQYFSEEFSKMLETARRRRVSLLDVERETLGVSHAEIGYWAADFWGFDDALAHAIRHHHGPAVSESTDIVNFSYVVTQAKMIGSPGDPVLTRFLPGLLKRLDISDQKLNELLVGLSEEYHTLTPIFRSVEGSL